MIWVGKNKVARLVARLWHATWKYFLAKMAYLAFVGESANGT
jgi:hypothetical protein